MIVDLIRHGEPEGGSRYRGHGCDDPLSTLGWAQMWAALGCVAQPDDPARAWAGGSAPAPYRRVFTSPLRRCRAFAEAYAQHAGLPAPVVIEALQEVGFGAWEGLTRETVQRERADEYARFYADPERNRPPGAEPLSAFRARVASGWRVIEATLDGEGGHEGRDAAVLVVAHAGTIRALVGLALAVPDAALYRIDCPYASLTRLIRSRERGWRVGFVNRPAV